jgi:hypothetical protein
MRRPAPGPGMQLRDRISGRHYEPREIQAAFLEGRNAHLDKVSRARNPYVRYREDELYYAWLRGHSIDWGKLG